MLTRVFRCLPVRDLRSVAQVCAGWRDLVYHQSFWCDVSVALDWNFNDLRYSDFLLLLDSLLVRGIRKIMTSRYIKLRLVSRHLPHLYSANLDNYKLSPRTWSSSLLRQMSNLTELSLGYVHAISDQSVRLLAEHLKKLVKLQLRSSRELTNSSLKYIAMGLPELKDLKVEECHGIDDVGIGYLCGIGLDQPPPAKLPQLQCLSLCFVKNNTELAFHHLSAGQPYIQKLHLHRFHNFSKTAFQWLATMRELRRLNISSNGLTGSGFVELANAHQPITYLDLSSTSVIDQELEHVGRLKQLRTLKLDDTKISDAGLQHLVRGGDSPISTLILWSCDGITDEGMCHVAQLRQLHKLILKVGDVELGHLAYGQSPVAIVECSENVTDAGLSHAATLPNLLSLDLSESELITGAGLKEFVASVRGPLTELRLWCGYSSCVCDEVGRWLECVARGLPDLTQLHVYGKHLNLNDILATARLLPRLHSLFLNEENITEEARGKFDGHVFQ